MNLGRYVLVVLGVALFALLLAWPLALRGLESASRWAVAYGGALAVLNAVLAYSLVRWSQGRPPRALVGAVLGGTLVRMGLLLLAVFVGIETLDLPVAPLIASLFALFALFLVMEIAVVQRDRVSVPEAGR